MEQFGNIEDYLPDPAYEELKNSGPQVHLRGPPPTSEGPGPSGPPGDTYQPSQDEKYDTYFNENQLPLTSSDIGPTSEDIENYSQGPSGPRPGGNENFRETETPYGYNGEGGPSGEFEGVSLF